MENSELTCTPTPDDVMQARKRTNAERLGNTKCTPGVCVICGHCFAETHHHIGEEGEPFHMKVANLYCDNALNLVDEADKLEANYRTKWDRQCPPLYRKIKPISRKLYPRIDWKQYDLSMKWDPASSKGLVIVGESGAGKSTTLWHLMLRVERARVNWRLYCGSKLTQAFFAAVKSRSVDALLEELATVPVLAFDDFGKSLITEGLGAFVFDLINRRTEYDLPIIMTTRFTGKNLHTRFSDDHTKGHDIARRLNDYCDVNTFRLFGKAPVQESLEV